MNKADFQDDQDEYSAAAYDYMAAYFDFFTDTSEKFLTARQLAKNYEKNGILKFRKMFAKISEMLAEIDRDEDGADDDQIDFKEAEARKAKAKIQMIHEVLVDQKTGALDIET